SSDLTQEQTDVVTGLTLVEELAEHLHTGDGGGLLLFLDANDVNGLVDVDDTALDTAGDDGAATGDREDVLDRHQEGLVGVTLGLGDEAVHGTHELQDGVDPLLLALEGLQSGDLRHRGVVAGELVVTEELANLELDPLEALLVVYHVGLVQGCHDRTNTDLACQEDGVLGLRQRAAGGRHDK